MVRTRLARSASSACAAMSVVARSSGSLARIRVTSIATLPTPTTAAASWLEVEPPVLEVGMPVVPADELGGGVAAGEVLPGNVERPVRLGAHGPDHRVVVAEEFVRGDVAPGGDVAEEPERRVRGHLVVDRG